MKYAFINASLIACVIFLSAIHGQQPAGVPLGILRGNAGAVISWPSPSRGFGLEFSPDLDWVAYGNNF